MKSKPTKWGIKLWAHCDSSNGYIWQFRVYVGAGDGKDKGKFGQGAAVVQELARKVGWWCQCTVGDGCLVVYYVLDCAGRFFSTGEGVCWGVYGYAVWGMCGAC